MNRDEARKLVWEHLTEENMRKHVLAVEAVMRGLARHFGQDEDTWGLAGLLHDLDYEKTRDDPSQHGLVSAGMLDEMGVRYVYQAKLELGGKKRTVDFLVPDKKLVIEYRSCFWHACPIHYRGVKGGILGRGWWERKMRRNRERDKELERLLEENGYRLLVVWEHDMKKGPDYVRRMLEVAQCA